MRPVGERSLLLSVDAPTAAARWIRSAVPSAVEVVPAARTVLVTVGSAAELAGLRRVLSELPASFPPDAADGPLVRVRVRFDGPDLAAVAASVGRPESVVVADVVAAPLVVAFCGFSPGFAYLSGLPTYLHVPRRADPRTRVPAGSFAVAGPYAAFYPRDSPGGWNLLGTTSAVLFDPAREPAALLTAGCRVRLELA